MNDYNILQQKLSNLIKDRNNNAFVIGKSTLGKEIYAFHKGNFLKEQILITGGIHAREYISSFVVMKLLEDYSKDVGCYFIPILNPDGIDICLNSINNIKNIEIKKMLLRLNNNSTDFSLWKANSRGVDLNVNFDAGFGESNFTKKLPCGGGFAGEHSNSEIENINILNFVKNKNITSQISYHSKGNVIYYGFEKLNKEMLKKELQIAKCFSNVLNYKKIRSFGSTGGFGDYLAYKYNIPSVTIELGNDNFVHPIEFEHFEEIYRNHNLALKNFVEKFYD